LKNKKIIELENEIKFCKKCKLSETRANAVPGKGNINSDIFFIGEAPGKNEDLQGEPFVGKSGDFLTELLTMIDLKCSDIFIGNVIKCRPPNNRNPKNDEIKNCIHFLEKQIKIISPKIIVMLGRYALNRFFPESYKISKCHGKAFRLKNKKEIYFPVYHPAMASYGNENRRILRKDFLKLRLLTCFLGIKK